MQRFIAAGLVLAIVVAFPVTSLAYNFSRVQYNWPSARAEMYIGGLPSWARPAFIEAMERWGRRSGFSFTYVDEVSYPCDLSDARNGVRFMADACGVSWPIDNQGMPALAVTQANGNPNPFWGRDIIFNSNVQWKIYDGPWDGGNSSGFADFKRTALHELGHVLGLGHEDSVPGIMSTKPAKGSVITMPGVDDVAGVHALYPCSDISGQWQFRETGTLQCSFSAEGESETSTDPISGSGSVLILQQPSSCSFSFDPPTGSGTVLSAGRRTGTIINDRLTATGLSGIPVSGVSLTTNTFAATGELERTVSVLENSAIEFRGEGRLGATVIGDQGVSVEIDCTSRSEATLTRSLAVPSLPSSQTRVSFPDRGGVSLVSSGSGPTVDVGYGRIQPDSGSTTPSGVAIFGYRQNGILVSEAGVPAAPLVTSGRIYAEVNGPVNTGLAFANPNENATTIHFFFTDLDGTDFGHGNFSLGAREQRAAFLDQAPFNATTSIEGTFTFASSEPISVIALRGLTNERSEFLMTTLPVASLTPATEDTIYLPRFVDGLGWTTQVILVNPTDQTITGTVQFLGTGTTTSAAGPLVLMLTDGRIDSAFTYQIPARSSRVLQTSNPAALSQGSVRIVREAGSSSASGLVVFSGAAGSLTFTEAGVPASPASAAFRMYAEVVGTPGAIGSIRSGVAISNTLSTATTVNLEITTLDGSHTGLTASEVVPGSGHISRFVDELFPNLTHPFQGVLRVISGSTPVAVVGLRLRVNERREFLITTTAPTDERSPTTIDELLLPHIVDGEGWTTQFILFSGVAGQSSSGTLRLFSRSGAPLDLNLQ